MHRPASDVAFRQTALSLVAEKKTFSRASTTVANAVETPQQLRCERTEWKHVPKAVCTLRKLALSRPMPHVLIDLSYSTLIMHEKTDIIETKTQIVGHGQDWNEVT